MVWAMAKDKKVFLLDKDYYTIEQVEKLTEKDLEEILVEEEYEENYTIIKIDANSYSSKEEAIKSEFPYFDVEDYYSVSFGF